MEREHVPSFSFNTMDIVEKIEHLLEVKFGEEAFSDCFLIEVSAPSNKRIQVFIDSDSGVSFSTCARISRYLEAELDDWREIAPNYKLDVSSPGVSRPLKFPRQYAKHIGRKLKVKTNDRREVKGVLEEVDEHGISLFYKERIKEGKKKIIKEMHERIAFEEINKSIVQISF